VDARRHGCTLQQNNRRCHHPPTHLPQQQQPPPTQKNTHTKHPGGKQQALLWEGVDLQPSWRVATEKIDPQALALNVLISGLFHYLNNEVMYLALDAVHPITLAVGNTAKRVFIIVASLVSFGRCLFCVVMLWDGGWMLM
jgi:hypothetical protein